MSRRARRLVSNGALLVGGVLLAGLAVSAARGWQQARDRIEQMGSEEALWQRQNAQVRRLHAALLPMPFKVCNARPEPVRVDWVYAAYPENGKMVVFDSSRCSDWQPVLIGDGKTQTLTLSSAEPGCNWSGRAVFYAMSFSRSDGYLNVAGPWGVSRGRAWDKKDCYTIP